MVAGAAHAFVMYTYESRGGVRARAFVNPIKCAGHRIFTERALARENREKKLSHNHQRSTVSINLSL